MKHLLFALALVCLVAGCKSTCTLETAISGGISTGIATALKCQNLSQIQSDVQGLIGKLTPGVCAAQSSSVQGIGGVICMQLGTLGVQALGTKIPANWQCDPSQAEAAVDAVISTACNAIPF